jgi:tripartite motif-containing protein 2/3/tripartite motif-containing protein 71
VAPDGFVFVADYGNHRVKVLSPDLTFYSIIGEGELHGPSGAVCANADVVVVSQTLTVRVSVFRRDDGALVRHFSSQGEGHGQLLWPLSVCFLPDDRHIAVADADRGHVSIFSVDGDFIRNVGDGVLNMPRGVACSGAGELVVADTGSRRVRVFDDNGSLVHSFGDAEFNSVVVHGVTVIAASGDGQTCVVFV